MDKKVLAMVLMLTFLPYFAHAGPAAHSYKPAEGYVPDAATAIKIAEAILTPIYGKEVINREQPLVAQLNAGVWVVTGTLHCPAHQRCLGGVAVIEIAKDDGRILRVSHGK